MYKSLKAVTAIAIIGSVMGCSTAQRASDVDGVRVSVAPYLKMSCKELATEQNSLIRQAESLGAQVDSEYRSDKNAELVAWVLFAPAAFFIDGNQESASELASLKGQLTAVQDAQKVNECTD